MAKSRAQIDADWKARNPEAFKAMSNKASKKWSQKHPEKVKQYRRKANEKYWPRYYAEHKDHHLTSYSKPSTYKRKIAIKDPVKLREYNQIISKDPCSYCNNAYKHTDHIVPISRQGTSEWYNLTSSCSKCNLRKSQKSLLIFLLERGENYS